MSDDDGGWVSLVLVSAHVVAVIVLIGPVTVAASLFPRYARRALEDPQGPAVPVVDVLQRISSRYAVAALAVPVLGLGAAASRHVLGQVWVLVSLAVTAVAAGVLAAAVVPGQRALQREMRKRSLQPSPGGSAPDELRNRLAAATGTFNLLWVIVVVLMVVQPGAPSGG